MRKSSVLLALAAISCGGGAPSEGAKAPAGGGDAKHEAEPAAPKPPAGPPVALDCGDFTTCAIAQGGEVRCWGRDKMGELGDGGGSDRSRSVPVGVNGTQVKLASNFACAVAEDKSVKCWGSGRITNDGKKLERVKPTSVGGVAGANDISASGVIACARSDDGIVCWGADEATIGKAPKGAFKQVATGFTHACALDAAGSVTCWGTGDWAAPKGAFASPGVKGATNLATGDRHACVVKDKKVLCWGQNDAGQLGTKPDTNSHPKPAEVPSVRDAVRVVAGEASTCAILADGSAMCWGANPQGELGLGKKSSDERPQRTMISDMTDICLATQHGCALTKSGKIYCWGGNKHGQLGDGSNDAHMQPTQVAW